MLNSHVVTSCFFEQAYRERSTVGGIMARLGSTVAVQATTVSSAQLELTSSATDSTVANDPSMGAIVRDPEAALE